MGCGSECSTCPFAAVEEELKKEMKKQIEGSKASKIKKTKKVRVQKA